MIVEPTRIFKEEDAHSTWPSKPPTRITTNGTFGNAGSCREHPISSVNQLGMPKPILKGTFRLSPQRRPENDAVQVRLRLSPCDDAPRMRLVQRCGISTRVLSVRSDANELRKRQPMP